MAENNEIKYPVTDVELPSRGIIYDSDLVPSIIQLRPTTTKEEKILYGSSASNVLDLVIKNCIVEPKDLNLSSLIVPDKYALLMNLRIISFGSLYRVNHRCEECKETNSFDIDLSELPINYLDNDFSEPFLVNLKTIDKKVEVRFLRGKDLDDVDNLVKRLKKNSNVIVPGDPGYTMRLAKYIRSIDGEDVTFDKALRFVESWTSRTSVEFRNAIDDIKVGYDLELIKPCPSCGEDMEFNLPFTGEFFRPTGR